MGISGASATATSLAMFAEKDTTADLQGERLAVRLKAIQATPREHYGRT
jgi:hypothetical protein